jgi:hypothetical protein
MAIDNALVRVNGNPICLQCLATFLLNHCGVMKDDNPGKLVEVKAPK